MDKVYSERNLLVALLSRLYENAFISPVVDEEGWFIVVIAMNSPNNKEWKVHSWHIPDSERYLFDHLSVKTDYVWDGETTEAKYDHIEKLVKDFK